jgi:hypothetical protein
MQTDVKPDDVPPPLAVAYYADTTPPMLPVVRGLGVLCIVFGGIGILLLLGELNYDRYLSMPRGIPHERLYRVSQIVAYGLSLVSGILNIVAGCGCLRRRPRGRRLLLICAWGALVWTGYTVGLSIWYSVTIFGAYSPGYLAGAMSYQVRRLIAGTPCQLIIILLMRNREFRRIFDQQGAD